MQSASTAYKVAMKQTLRNQSLMRVTVGVINQEAQRTAHISPEGEYAYFSNLVKPFDNYSVDHLYATAEKNFSVVDGSMAFLPRGANDVVLNAGIVTEKLLGSIRIDFDTAYDIKGLTVDFGRSYPVNFAVESDNNSIDIEGNGEEQFVTEEVFPQARYIRIIPSLMVNGQARLRIHQITMGIGIYFSNKGILSSLLKESISPISEDIPAVDFNLEVDNQRRVYDIENEESSINFMETGQKCIVEYGYEIEEGVIEWMPGAVLFLKTWSADDIRMKVSAVDRFAYMQDRYYKGRYYAAGINLYDLAVDVLEDAQVDEREYWIDGYLKSIIVYNPLPPCTHKEALQIIANAGRCILSQDREAKIYLKSSFIPDMTAASDNEAYFSKTANILMEEAKDMYAVAVRDIATAGGSQYFLPRPEAGAGYLNTGYISKAVSGGDGSFSSNPMVVITLEASFKCFSLMITFGGKPPEELVIHTFREDMPVEDVIIKDVEEELLVRREFTEFDRMELEITRAPAYNRVMIDHIKFGEETDYILKKSLDLTKTPVGNRLEKIRELQVFRTMYNPSDEQKELIRESVTVPDGGDWLTFQLPNASYGYNCILDGAELGQGASIEESGAYYVVVSLHGYLPGEEVNLIITGYEYAVTAAAIVKSINPTGTVESWTNPLVSTKIHATDLAEWIGEYMVADREYNVSYRGDPRIDANDILFMENDYIHDMQIRVLERTLNFNGSLSGSLKARRIMHVDNA